MHVDLIELQIDAEIGYNKLNVGEKWELYGKLPVIPFKQREATIFSSEKHKDGKEAYKNSVLQCYHCESMREWMSQSHLVIFTAEWRLELGFPQP